MMITMQLNNLPILKLTLVLEVKFPFIFPVDLLKNSIIKSLKGQARLINYVVRKYRILGNTSECATFMTFWFIKFQMNLLINILCYPHVLAK